uniref:PHD-type domain-containing protein n=1 Tax=Paramormyrops kingsleyae TaxID=1676925 RepID=A0A3B3RFN4_9TELE
MQSFRERSCFHGNQHCYQQGPYELSRLESYRHQRSQTRQGYEAHSLAAAPLATAADSTAKDCYSQQAYPGYSSNPAPAEKQYKGGKVPSRQLQSSYAGHLGNTYSGVYMAESHLQQKWPATSHMSQYDQDMLAKMEPVDGVRSTGSQYLQPNVLPVSQNRCTHAAQSRSSVYSSHHQQKLPQDASPSPASYSHGQLHFPQHSQSLSASTPSYVEKCNATSHCYKSYAVPPNSQYSRNTGNTNSLKQNSYRAQSNYVYQQASSRSGYEQQASLQGMTNSQESISKYQHFTQPQQSYCLTDLSVRSPEHYYQNCSPNSSQSPARSVGRSPTYSSTPSPLMVSSDSFQYSQPPIASGTSSSTSLRDQGLLMPQKSHSTSNINPKTTSYASSLKDRFSEKLLSNPSLWSLNALTSQVENISNNVQHLLLSDSLVINKKGNKRSNPKQEEEFKDHLRNLEEVSCTATHNAESATEAFGTPQSIHDELQEDGCSSEVQMERNYYYCNQSREPVQAIANCNLTLDVSSCSVTALDNISKISEDSASGLQITQVRENIDTILRTIGEETSQSNLVHSPLNPEPNSQEDINKIKESLKEDFEETSLLEKPSEQKVNENLNNTMASACNDQNKDTKSKQEEWLKDEEYPTEFPKTSQVLTGKTYPSDIEEQIDYEMEQGCITEEDNTAKSCAVSRASSNRSSDSHSDKKSMPLAWKDETVALKDNTSKSPHFNTMSELLEEGFSILTKEKTLEEQESIRPSETSVVKEQKESLPYSEESINNKTWLQPEELCSPTEEQRDKSQVSKEADEQDMPFTNSERSSVSRDIAPLTHCVKAGFSVFNEEASLLPQARDHIDRRDAVELEPDSPQLPGKSIIHSAPSWADTPPSPKKGDEEVDPEMSCVSAVTSSTESEPMAPSANLTAFSRRHVRGRRRQSRILIHASTVVTRLSNMDEKEVPESPQEINMAPTKTTVLAEQRRAVHKDLFSQTCNISAENFPSRMCTRSFTAMAASSSCPHLKKRGPKPYQQFDGEDSVGHTKGLITKTDWKKLRDHKTAITSRKGLSEIMNQDENQETGLSLTSVVKDQKSMVLRSRKQAQENPVKEKGMEKKTMCILPKTIKEMKKQETTLLKEQCCDSPKQTLASVHRKNVYRSLISKPNEKSESATKRKSNCQSMVPIKRQRMIKGIKFDKLPLKTNLSVVKSPKKRLKRDEIFTLPLNSFLTKDPSPVNVNDISLPVQYPVKTKYLPPRKGRGLKYEAMVQKMTSLGTKKHSLNTHFDNIVENLPKKIIEDVLEQVKPAEDKELVHKDGELAKSTMVLENTTCLKDSDAIKEEGSQESSKQPDLALETQTAFISTQRIAKQRAIKNNHEMHLKQRRSRRKSHASQVSSTATKQEPLPIAPSEDREKQLGSSQASPNFVPGKHGFHSQRKARVTALDKQGSVAHKAVSKRTTDKYFNHGKVAKNGRRFKATHRKQDTLLAMEEQLEYTINYLLCKLPKNETLPLFRPYVHVDKMAHFASVCTVINGPEEEHLLFQARRKKIQDAATVSKAIPDSSVMLQGPLVNKNLIDRSLTCCLCGKPTNYKELGDLCGPYYPEDSIPRKTLSFKYRQLSREDKVIMNCNVGHTGALKREGGRSLAGRSSCEGNAGQLRGAERASVEGVARPKFLERYKRLQQLQGSERRAGEDGTRPLRLHESGRTALQGAELEAESREHWLHEACAVWTGGVFLVSGKLYGVKEAARATAATSCSVCQDMGASIRCSYEGCPQNFHYFCAKEIGRSSVCARTHLSYQCLQSSLALVN